MDAPEDDPILQAAVEIEQVCSDKNLLIPKEVKTRLEKAADRLRRLAKDVWGGTGDHEPHVDGCADISVVTIGTLSACGVADAAILVEVDNNNIAKFGPGGHRRPDGKWVKPPGHKPPDIAGILRGQG